MEEKRKQKFQDLEENNTTYNEKEIILDLTEPKWSIMPRKNQNYFF